MEIEMNLNLASSMEYLKPGLKSFINVTNKNYHSDVVEYFAQESFGVLVQVVLIEGGLAALNHLN